MAEPQSDGVKVAEIDLTGVPASDFREKIGDAWMQRLDEVRTYKRNRLRGWLRVTDSPPTLHDVLNVLDVTPVVEFEIARMGLEAYRKWNVQCPEAMMNSRYVEGRYYVTYVGPLAVVPDRSIEDMKVVLS
jgi:hypothetical protein